MTPKNQKGSKRCGEWGIFMKRFNFLILGMAALYVVFALLLLRPYGFGNVQNGMEYKVEINDLLERAGQGESLSALPLEDCSYVKNICFLAARDLKDPEKVQDFFGIKMENIV